MPIAFLLCAAVTFDPWTLKPPIATGSKCEWACSMDAEANGSSHAATFDLSEAGKDGGKADAPAVHLEIADLQADSNPLPGASVDAVVNAQNVLQSTSDDDGDRRMFTPLLFVYPSGPVNVGDTWKSTVSPATKDAPKVNLQFTVKQADQVDGADTVEVTSTVKEEGTDNLSADGTWWIDPKSGQVVKFKLTLKNWFVTMANGMTVDGTMSGKLKKQA